MGFSAMRPLKIFVVLCLAIVVATIGGTPASADTIYLKNGRKIIASHVVRKDGQVTFETAAGQLSLPASIVDRVEEDVETGDSQPTASGDRAASLAIAPPNAISAAAGDEAAHAAVHDGSIDTGMLARLESDADLNPSASAISRVVAAETAAAQFEITVGDLQKAQSFYQAALRYTPDNAGLLIGSAYLHLRRSEYTAALDLLDRAQRSEPDSPDAAKLTGWAYYGLNRLDDAVKEWKRALALRPDTDVQQALDKVERDANEEADYKEGETLHFRLRYNGGEAPQLAHDVLQTLEREFDEISTALDYTPPEPIAVILYTNQTFTDITRAPSWVGALNDGRMRIPVEGLSSMTDELARVLKHELTHSFITQKTQGRCPIWMQEGIAQYMEGKRSHAVAATLSAEYEQHMEISLASFESSWMNLPPETVANAYAWSLAVIETLVNADGMDDLGRILDRIGSDSTAQDAIRSILHESYADLMQDTVQYLRKAYL
jgi:tetratricopeptide (TPR) repeat protein